MHKEGKRILVAEHDGAARDMLGALLVQAGYSVCATKDGQETLMEMQRKHYDVVVTDCNLPYLDDRGWYSLSRAARQQTPIIMLSGDVAEAPETLKQLEVFAWVTKPYDTWFLLEIIRDAACGISEKPSSVAPAQAKGL
jgi:DNA-binding response OmpR family regulator